MSKSRTIDGIRFLELENEQLLVLDDPAGSRLKVLDGRIWLTEPGRAQDRIAVAGDELALQASGRVVVEALGRTRLELDPRRRPRQTRLAGLVARALAAARAGAAVPFVAAMLAGLAGIGVLELAAEAFLAGSDGRVQLALAAVSTSASIPG